MRPAAWSLLLVLSACDAAPATQVMLQVDAEPTVRMETAQLLVHVRGGEAGTDPTTWASRHRDTFTDLMWPRRIALVPLEPDPPRAYSVEIRAERADGTLVTVSTIRGGYVPNRTKLIVLRLEDACLDVDCADMRCEEGRCVDSLVDVAGAPDLGTDAGI